MGDYNYRIPLGTQFKSFQELTKEMINSGYRAKLIQTEDNENIEPEIISLFDSNNKEVARAEQYGNEKTFYDLKSGITYLQSDNRLGITFNDAIAWNTNDTNSIFDAKDRYYDDNYGQD